MGPGLAYKGEPATPEFLKPHFNASKAHPTNGTLFVQVSDGIESCFALLSSFVHRTI